MNPERADVTMLNDASDVFLDGYRIEGPANAVTNINNGKTTIKLFNAGLGLKSHPNPIFENCEGTFSIQGAWAFGGDPNSEYDILFREYENGKVVDLKWDDYNEMSDEYIQFIDVAPHALTFNYEK